MKQPAGSLPQHVAIIMDGNGRWARSRKLERIEGHRAGATAVRAVVEEAVRLRIPYLSLFAFSWENWERSQAEVSGLMELLALYLESELPLFIEHDIRLRAIGNFERIPESVHQKLFQVIDKTSHHKGLQLVLALSYSGQIEILEATKRCMEAAAKGELQAADLNAETFRSRLYAPDIPDPDLLIRTSGESRISNFYLWQLAYSEIYLASELWPDFGKDQFRQAIEDYSKRERRYGLESPDDGQLGLMRHG